MAACRSPRSSPVARAICPPSPRTHEATGNGQQATDPPVAPIISRPSFPARTPLIRHRACGRRPMPPSPQGEGCPACRGGHWRPAFGTNAICRRQIRRGMENKTAASAIGEVHDSSNATAAAPTRTRRNGAAVVSVNIIAQGKEGVKRKTGSGRCQVVVGKNVRLKMV